uniref:Ig-like domain-containing protein n=1 Tax=Salmo trutta TaxID=8032 RepID=A0A674A762_SALTR
MCDVFSAAQGHNCWSVTYTKRRICVLKASTVNISCSYTHPTSYIEQGSFWFTQKHPVDLSSYPEYAGRVEYNRNTENHHTMTITDLTEKDSAEYKFRLLTTDEGSFSGLPGVMLTVTDILLEMDPTSVSEGERVTLRCRTKCTVGLNPTYIWYKNRQRLTNPITSYNSLILDPVTSYNSLILDPVTSYNSLILDPVSSYNSLILDPVTSYNSLILDTVSSYNSLILDPVTSYNSLILDPVSSYNSLILDPVTSYNSLILDPVSSEDAGNYSCAV